MNNLSRRIVAIILAGLALALAGCGALKPLKVESEDKALNLQSVTVTPGVDGVATTLMRGEVMVYDKESKQYVKQTLVQMVTNTPTGVKVVEGFTGGVGQAVVQGEYGKQIAKIGRCQAGANCGTVLVNENLNYAEGGTGGAGGQAAAVSGSASNSNSTTNVSSTVSTGGPVPCKSSSCTGR